MRGRGALIVAIVIVIVLLACIVIAALGVFFYVAGGNIDIPYPDGPPSLSVKP